MSAIATGGELPEWQVLARTGTFVSFARKRSLPDPERSDCSPNRCRSRVIKRTLTASSAGRHQRMNAEVVDASGEDSRGLGRTLTALEQPTQASACPGLIFPTFGGHLQEGILALNEVFYGTQRI